MNQATVLILDDDPVFARAAGKLAFQEGCKVEFAHTLREARAFTRAHRTDLILLDLNLPDGSGLDLMDDLDPACHGQVAVVTGDPTVDTAVRALGWPAVDYLVKPFRSERLQRLLRRAMRLYGPDDADGRGDADVVDRYLPGNSPAVGALRDSILRVAANDVPVLLLGETGTGKRSVARAIHETGARDGPFIVLDAAAMAEHEQSSRLFGGDDGSAGTLGRAGDGTLLLQQVSALHPRVQARLCAVLEARREGDGMHGPRLLFSLREDPATAIADGRLCTALYYAISGLSLPVPPLRDRGEDVVLLAELFIDQLNARHHQRRRLAPGADRELLRHAWPGNLRELRGAVERAYAMQRSDQLRVVPLVARPAPDPGHEGAISFAVGTPLAELEQRAVRATLSHYGNDKPAAARALGISVRTIYNHIARGDAGGDDGSSGTRETAA